MAGSWYAAREAKEIVSTNFQLHPPRGKDTNTITNKCGNLDYPLLFCAVRGESGYEVQTYDPDVLKSGACTKAA